MTGFLHGRLRSGQRMRAIEAAAACSCTYWHDLQLRQRGYLELIEL